MVLGSRGVTVVLPLVAATPVGIFDQSGTCIDMPLRMCVADLLWAVCAAVVVAAASLLAVASLVAAATVMGCHNQIDDVSAANKSGRKILTTRRLLFIVAPQERVKPEVSARLKDEKRRVDVLSPGKAEAGPFKIKVGLVEYAQQKWRD